MPTATKTFEVVTVVDVNKNERDWYEVEVSEYDEPLVTKEKKLADAALAAKGGSISASIGVKVNGNFTNRYLNAVESANGASAPAAPASGTQSEIPTVSKRDERSETQERIARQWAMGRSVELHIASGGTAADVLDTDKFAQIKAVADVLLLATSGS